MALHPLTGSERQPLPGAKSAGKADPAERLEVSVLLRRHGGDALAMHVKTLATQRHARTHMTREAFEQRFGVDSSDIATVKKFATAHKLSVVQEHAGRRTVVLSGTVAQFNAAFGVDLQRFDHPGGSYRGRVGAIRLPPELQGVVEAVLGLDDRPVARPHFRARRPHGNIHWHVAEARPPSSPRFRSHHFITFRLEPARVSVAIIELGGGSGAERRSQQLLFFWAFQIKAAPRVTAVSVDHGKNHPTGDPNGPDGEVMLDIEVVGAVAPGAKPHRCLASSLTGMLWLPGCCVTTAIHDTTNKPSVISISWGGPESSWTAQSMTAFDSAFQAAAAMGVTVCIASGDNGSSDGVTDGANHVDFPASSPHALARGGTSLQASGNTTSLRDRLE